METKKVRVRLDRENYQEVVLRELDWKEDIAIMRSCRKEKIDPVSLKKVEHYDTDELRAKRFYASMQEQTILEDKTQKLSFDNSSLDQINHLLKKDMALLAVTWEELNEVTDAEKSGSVGSDSGRQATHGGTVDESAQGHDNKDMDVRSEESSSSRG